MSRMRRVASLPTSASFNYRFLGTTASTEAGPSSCTPSSAAAPVSRLGHSAGLRSLFVDVELELMSQEARMEAKLNSNSGSGSAGRKSSHGADLARVLTGRAGTLDRSLSDLQLSQGAVQAIRAQLSSSPLHKLLQLCKPCSSLEQQLATAVRTFLSGNGGLGGYAPSSSGVSVEALAAQLLASGFLVQIRNGCKHNSFRSLRHKFVVVIGHHSHQDPVPYYVDHPIIVEPCFRDQFVIANPTVKYRSLLQALPIFFVGSLPRLAGVVAVMANELSASFKDAGGDLPPWRTQQAIMSKWSPAELEELTKLLQHQCSSTGQLGPHPDHTTGPVSHMHNICWPVTSSQAVCSTDSSGLTPPSLPAFITASCGVTEVNACSGCSNVLGGPHTVLGQVADLVGQALHDHGHGHMFSTAPVAGLSPVQQLKADRFVQHPATTDVSSSFADQGGLTFRRLPSSDFKAGSKAKKKTSLLAAALKNKPAQSDRIRTVDWPWARITTVKLGGQRAAPTPPAQQ